MAEGNIKIVIAEDDPLMTRVYQEALMKAGYVVETFFNGQDALHALQDMKVKPNLIMSDVMMPKMSGLELLEKLRASEELKTIPFVLITNLAQKEYAEKGLALGAIAYLVKGQYTLKELAEKIHEFISIRTDSAMPTTNVPIRDIGESPAA
jgi:CheY-like chemotaxis protein